MFFGNLRNRKLTKIWNMKIEKWRNFCFLFFPNIIILQKNPISGKNIFFENLRKLKIYRNGVFKKVFLLRNFIKFVSKNPNLHSDLLYHAPVSHEKSRKCQNPKSRFWNFGTFGNFHRKQVHGTANLSADLDFLTQAL